jgi:hypothetical protein
LSAAQVADYLGSIGNIRFGSGGIQEKIGDVIAANSTDNGKDIKDIKGNIIGWSNFRNFKNKEDSANTVRISIDDNYSEKMEPQSNGAIMTITDKENVAGELLKNFESTGGTSAKILAGSVIEEKLDAGGTVKITITNTGVGAGAVSMSGHYNASWLYALTVTRGTTGVKVIFNATATTSTSFGQSLTGSELAGLMSGDMDMLREIIGTPRVGIGGTLKVYGQGDKEVFGLEIKTVDTLNEYLAYFGSYYEPFDF